MNNPLEQLQAEGRREFEEKFSTGDVTVHQGGWSLLPDEILSFQSSLIARAFEEGRKTEVAEIIELVQQNHKGTFTDEGGNDCWYIADLVKALTHLEEIKRQLN